MFVTTCPTIHQVLCKHIVGTSPSFAYCFNASLFYPQHLLFQGAFPACYSLNAFYILGCYALIMMATAVFMASFPSSGCFYGILAFSLLWCGVFPHCYSFFWCSLSLSNSLHVYRRTVNYGWLIVSAMIGTSVINYSLLIISCSLDIKKWKLLKR